MHAAPAIAILFLSGSPAAVVGGLLGGSCSRRTTCGACLQKPGCTWFQDIGIGYCETGCGMDGCGASVCPSSLDTCADCLGGPGTEASGQYSWTPDAGAAGECVASCMDAPADSACYKGKSSADPSGYDPDICPSISVCRKRRSCGACLRGGACAWSEGRCYDSCSDYDVPMDTSCFEGKTYSRKQACGREDDEGVFATD